MIYFILHKSISCFSHSLQLVVRKFDAVRAPKRALIIAHKLMSKVCKSVKATEKLVSLSGRKLVNDVPTRWNSTLLQRELSLRFANVLQPQVAGFNPLYVKATALDLRYYILLDREQLQHAKTQLLREVGAIYQDIQFPPPLYSLISLFQFSDEVEETVAGTSDSETEPDPEAEPHSKRFHYLTSIIKEKRKQQESTHAKTPLSPVGNEEIVWYLESCPHIDEKVDSVEFWIENEKAYPSLAPLACDLLTIPASSVPIERVFSTAGQITSGKRNRLNDNNLEREVLLKKNKLYL